MPAEIQYEGARKALQHIRTLRANKEVTTYADLAELMGRDRADARAVAQMCNLLDAAATVAGVPTVALVTVRSSDNEVNPAAFKDQSNSYRQQIVERAQLHVFSESDFQAITVGLDQLGGRGSDQAWKYIWDLYPGDLIRQRLLGLTPDQDAISDLAPDPTLGTDVPDRAWGVSSTYQRDPGVRRAVLIRAQGRCEYCGTEGFKKPDGTAYLEAHHIISLSNDGADRTTNVIALCANDHRRAHFGADGEQLEIDMTRIIRAKHQQLN